MNNLKSTAFFHCDNEELESRINSIDPRLYDRTRNYMDGAVTWLSPFVTHGIIDTKDIAAAVLAKFDTKACEKLLFELAWREYFHRVWQTHGDNIFSDMKNPCMSDRTELPSAVCNANTGVEVVDDALTQLMQVGSMHNHARMWVASICCNMGNTHWLPAAKWMHYHLLDGDLASNTLSWQWVAGTFSNKHYFANQDNINKFSKTEQPGTFIDVPYEAFDDMPIPTELLETHNPDLPQNLPGEDLSDIEPIDGSVALRSVWHLHNRWQSQATHQWLFIDTDLFSQWPMSDNRWSFILHWAGFIPNVRIVKGTSDQLQTALANATVYRQEYTACRHWGMQSEQRRWLYPNPPKPYSSFSKFWKQVKTLG